MCIYFSSLNIFLETGIITINWINVCDTHHSAYLIVQMHLINPSSDYMFNDLLYLINSSDYIVVIIGIVEMINVLLIQMDFLEF